MNLSECYFAMGKTNSINELGTRACMQTKAFSMVFPILNQEILSSSNKIY